MAEACGSEEGGHLAWCASGWMNCRIGPSLLNPVWYAGPFSIGALAGLAG